MPGQVLVSVRGVTRRFGHVVAVDGLSSEVRRGEVFGLLVDTPQASERWRTLILDHHELLVVGRL